MAAYLSDRASYRKLKRALNTGTSATLMELTGADTEHEAREQTRRLCRGYRKTSPAFGPRGLWRSSGNA